MTDTVLGSADIMNRNLDRRVEVLFPIEDEKLKDRIRTEVLDPFFADNVKMRFLESDGSYTIYGVPAGRWKVYAYSRRAEKPVGAQVEVQAGRTAVVELTVVETRVDFRHRNKYGETYRDPTRYR